VRKLLKDYPQNEWTEAADGCEFCGAKHMVLIDWVDDSGNFGRVAWKIEHEEGCPERSFTAEEGDDIVGWEFMEKPHVLLGKEYYPLSSRANIGPCLECERLVVGIPLILFIDEGRGGELDFCWSCAKELGILNMVTGGREGG